MEVSSVLVGECDIAFEKPRLESRCPLQLDQSDYFPHFSQENSIYL